MMRQLAQEAASLTWRISQGLQNLLPAKEHKPLSVRQPTLTHVLPDGRASIRNDHAAVADCVIHLLTPTKCSAQYSLYLAYRSTCPCSTMQGFVAQPRILEHANEASSSPPRSIQREYHGHCTQANLRSNKFAAFILNAEGICPMSVMTSEDLADAPAHLLMSCGIQIYVPAAAAMGECVPAVAAAAAMRGD